MLVRFSWGVERALFQLGGAWKLVQREFLILKESFSRKYCQHVEDENERGVNNLQGGCHPVKDEEHR